MLLWRVVLLGVTSEQAWERRGPFHVRSEEAAGQAGWMHEPLMQPRKPHGVLFGDEPRASQETWREEGSR